MRQVTCSNCSESFQAPDDLAQAHCVRCGQAVALETNITASAVRPEAYLERPPEDALRAPIELPERYANWEEMRQLAPAIHSELETLATRAIPDLRRLRVDPLPDHVPAEIDGWARPLGTLHTAGEDPFYTRLAGVLIPLFSVCFVAFELTNRDRGLVDALWICLFGAAGVCLGIWYGFVRRPRLGYTIWVFEEGLLVLRGNRLTGTRWDEVLDFQASAEKGRPLYRLTLEPGAPMILYAGHAPEIMPLMEYLDIRLSASQFLQRLESICKGKRERFGVLTLDRQGIQGMLNFFAPWSEIKRVISDSKQLFIDWSQRPEWVPVRYYDVSFPYLVMAIAHVMIDEHKRLPPVDA